MSRERRNSIALCLSSILAISLIFTCSLLTSCDDPVEMSPQETGIKIDNINAIAMEYEKNAMFISSGHTISKSLDNGKAVRLESSSIVIDHSAFIDGVPGHYDIHIEDKTTNRETSYKATVIESEIVSIKLGDFRKDYFLGENIIPQDVQIIKIRSDGTEVKAKPNEYQIGDSQYDNSQIGQYQISVTLLSNASFSLDYTVNVKDYTDISFDGKYSYIDNTYTFGAPNVFAFEIENNVMTHYYGEIYLSGLLEINIVDGNLIFSHPNITQTMRYVPAHRSFIVKGIAGDPDLECTSLANSDFVISVVGELTQNHHNSYIAKDGTLSYSTISYLTYNYGGIYTDSSFSTEIDYYTVFDENTTVVVGHKPVINEEQPYVGIWYRKDWRSLIYLEADLTMHSGRPEFSVTFTAQNDGQGNYMLRTNSQGNMYYVKNDDTLNLLHPETGEIYLTYRRYNPLTQLIVTINHNNSIDQFVINKGEAFEAMTIKDDEISWYSIPSYKGELLYNDITFYNATRQSNYLTDFTGYMFGDLSRYFTIEDNDWDDILTSGHRYVLVEYYRLEEVGRGYIAFFDKHSIDNSYDFKITPINGKDEVFYINISTQRINEANRSYFLRGLHINGNEQTFVQNLYPFGDLPIVGTYYASDNTELWISAKGCIGIVKHNTPTSYSVEMVRPLVKSISENEVLFIMRNYYEPSESARFTTYELKISRLNEHFTFVYEGKTFTRSDTPSAAFLRYEETLF